MKTPNPTTLAGILRILADVCNEARIDERIHRGPKSIHPTSLFLQLLVVKGLFGFNSETSFLRYLNKHHAGLFPSLPERSWFNRKAKTLTTEVEELHLMLLAKLGADAAEIRIVDATGVPVVKLHRAKKCKSFTKKAEVAFGYCASKKTYYYGQKLTLLVTPEGIPTSAILTPANHADIRAFKEHLPTLKADVREKTVVGDRGYYDGALDCELKEKYNGIMVTPEKKRHQKKNTRAAKRLLKKRAIVETVIEQLQDHMRIQDTKAKSKEGLAIRIQSVIASFVFGAYLNSLAGRDLLAVKSILM